MIQNAKNLITHAVYFLFTGFLGLMAFFIAFAFTIAGNTPTVPLPERIFFSISAFLLIIMGIRCIIDYCIVQYSKAINN